MPYLQTCLSNEFENISHQSRRHPRNTSHTRFAENKLFLLQFTGKSLSEALIFASTKPQYDDRLFIELQVQYMKIPSSN